MDKPVASASTQVSKTIWRIFFILLAMGFFFVIYPYIKTVILMIIISWLLAMILNPLVDYLESVGLNRALAIVIVIVIILACIIGMVALIVPSVMSAIDSLTAKLQTNLIKDLTVQLEQFFKKNFNNAGLARDLITKGEQLGGEMLIGIGQFLKNAGAYVAFIGIVPFLTFFMIKDKRLFKRMLISQVPNRYFELFLNVLQKVGNQVSKYIQGQAIDALIVGLLSVVGLFIINLVFGHPVPFFFFIGMLAGIANLIPYLGPIVGAVPAIVLTALNSPGNVGTVIVWIAVVFMLVQVIDNNIISPLVVSKSVNMHPITVVIAVVIGGNIGGMIGMLFAVPVWGIIKVTLKEVSWGLRSYKLR